MEEESHPYSNDMHHEGYEGAEMDYHDYHDEHPDFQRTGNTRVSMDDSQLDYRDIGSEPYPSLRRVPSPSSANRRSMDDSYFADARMQKIAQTEAMIRDEMFRDCTFRPKIKGLPTAYGPLKENGTPFVQRVLKWDKEKKLMSEKKASQAKKAETMECTFRPVINKYSDLAAKEIRGESPEPASDRLYRSYLTVHENRQRLIEQETMKEEKLLEMECTFKPQLKTKSNPQFQHITPKFMMQPQSAVKQQQQQQQHKNKEFSFTPQINKIKPNMSSAKLYVSTNVVDRLTKPIAMVEKKEDNGMQKTFDDSFDNATGQVIDAATYIGSLQSGNNNSYSTPGGARSAMKSASKGQLSGESVQSGGESEQKSTNFNDFLERQKLVLKKREEKLEKATVAMTPQFKPKISAKSKSIIDNNVNERKQADFIARVERDLQKRKSFEQRAELQHDRECTFQPTINDRASNKPTRSMAELSFGDQMRVETKRRMMKMKAEEEESRRMPFKPQLSERAKQAKGVLRISEDPSSYLEWIKAKKDEQERERQLEAKRREEMEVQECTFAPNTIECPAYIKRIAESISKMKSARGSGSLNGDNIKPDWR